MSFSLFAKSTRPCRLADELDAALEEIAILKVKNEALIDQISKQASAYQQSLKALKRENKDLRGKNECQQRKFEEIKAVLHVN